MTCTAPLCGKTTGAAMNLCFDCTETLEQHLRSTPSLHADLVTLLTRQTAVSQGPGGSSGETALPYDWKASEVLERMEGLAGDWARCISENAGDRLRCDQSWVGYAGWLNKNIRHLRKYEAAGDAMDELSSAYREALRAVDLKPERRYAGPCPECGASIWGIRGSEISYCRECARGVETEAHMMERLGAAWEHEANPTTIVRALNAYGLQVKLGTVQQWIHRGHLVPSALEPVKLYRVADVYGIIMERAVVGAGQFSEV